MAQWRFIDSGPAKGAVNMAADARLLEEAAAGDVLPALRFYAWSPPAVSLGRFQDETEAVNAESCRIRGIDIVRRITGGRAVLHDRELTYSVISRIDNGLFPNDVMGTYKAIAAGLLAGLHLLGVPAEMVSRSGRYAGLVKSGPKEAACFSSPSWYEILVNGRKIAGSAQRRVTGAFLQHGSILIDYDASLEAEIIPGAGERDTVTSISREVGREMPFDEIKDAFREGFSHALGISFI